jgi:pimeloyl-ACP methyl ester carboxylesterase
LVIACRKRLDSIADLTQYTTPIAVEDMEEVCRWLGYDRIEVMGLSYGTRLALTYMKMHPDRIRSAVLIGPLAPSVRVPSLHAPAGQRALDLMVSDCEGDTACSRAFPKFRQNIETVSHMLDGEGVSVNIKHRVSGDEVTLRIRKDIFFERMRSKMYMINSAREIPWIIESAAQGNFSPFLATIIPEEFNEPPWIAEGLYLSLTCAEDIPFIDTVAARQSSRSTYFGDYRVSQQVNAARHWPKGSLPPGYHDSFTSEVPTLIISGVRDPITPPEFADEIESVLTKCLVVTVPSMAHVPAGTSNSECIGDLITRFFSAGNADSLDVSCVKGMQAPPFKISDE